MSGSTAQGSTRDPHEFLAEQAQAVAARWSKQCDDLRASASSWGNAVVTVGTVIVGAFGLKNVPNMFPIGGHLGWLYAIFVSACVLLMAASAIWLARRLSRASRAIEMSVDLDEMQSRKDREVRSIKHIHVAKLEDNSFTSAELGIIEHYYSVFAELNRPSGINEGEYSVKAYNDVALAIEKDAESTDEARRAAGLQRLGRAAQIRAEVYATQVKAMAAVVRNRVNDARGGRHTILAILLFVSSLIGVVTFSSFAVDTRSNHSDSIELVKSCAEAAKSLREAQASNLIALPANCIRR